MVSSMFVRDAYEPNKMTVFMTTEAFNTDPKAWAKRGALTGNIFCLAFPLLCKIWQIQVQQCQSRDTRLLRHLTSIAAYKASLTRL